MSGYLPAWVYNSPNTVVFRTQNSCSQNSTQLLPELKTVVARTQNSYYQNSKTVVTRIHNACCQGFLAFLIHLRLFSHAFMVDSEVGRLADNFLKVTCIYHCLTRWLSVCCTVYVRYVTFFHKNIFLNLPIFWVIQTGVYGVFRMGVWDGVWFYMIWIKTKRPKRNCSFRSCL